jgi:hypothetical protein
LDCARPGGTNRLFLRLRLIFGHGQLWLAAFRGEEFSGLARQTLEVLC